MSKYTVADFFCGAGGFSEGFYQAGYNVVFGLDNWAPSIKTHNLNHSHCNVVNVDILTLDTPEKIDEVVPDTDIIIGSPPCVSFSNSNKSGKADKNLGIQLIKQFLKIILWKKSKGVCKYWIMENVPNSLKYINDIYTWKELGLPGDGPDLVVVRKEQLLASDYGAPQDRTRAFCGDYISPTKILHKYNIQDIFDMLGNPVGPKRETYTDCIYGDTYLAKTITDHFYDTTIPDFKLKNAERLKTDHGYMGKMSFPDKQDRCCRTIMATQSTSTREAIIFSKEDGSGYRSPTIREISCLMGFPLNYQFYGNSESTKHKQIGNAVCPPIAKALGIAIITQPMKRTIKLAPYNLNGRVLKPAIEKPRKITSKFHQHVPHLKINQMRVELSNDESDFQERNFRWSCILHRGSGKKAKKCRISNDTIELYILESEHQSQFNLFKISIIHHFENTIYSSEEFQKKMCRINTIYKHKSPNEVLNILKKCIDKHIDVETIIKIEECVQTLGRLEIPIKLIFALWGMNYVLQQMTLAEASTKIQSIIRGKQARTLVKTMNIITPKTNELLMV